jgi:hypothetical protein
VPNGAELYYEIKDGDEREVCEGVYTASGTTLTRTTLGSTTGSALNLSGSAEVRIGPIDRSLRADNLALSATVLSQDNVQDALETLAGNAFGFRNRVINPSGLIAQITPGSTADAEYTGIDQWIALTRSNPVNASRISNLENGTPNGIRLTQSNASDQQFGLVQWMETANVKDLRGEAVTLSARVRMSASATLHYAILEWTSTADSVTKDVIATWFNNTLETTNITVTAQDSVALTANTLTSIELTGTVSSSMNNMAVVFWTGSVQAQGVTLDVAKVQLEQGSSATPFALRSYQEEFLLCARYLAQITASATGDRMAFGQIISAPNGNTDFTLDVPVLPRSSTPSITFSNLTTTNGTEGNDAVTAISLNYVSGAKIGYRPSISGAFSGTSGDFIALRANSASAYVRFDSRL